MNDKFVTFTTNSFEAMEILAVQFLCVIIISESNFYQNRQDKQERLIWSRKPKQCQLIPFKWSTFLVQRFYIQQPQNHSTICIQLLQTMNWKPSGVFWN